MAKPVTRTAPPAPGASDAAAAFADGHVDPIVPTASATTEAALRGQADPLETVREAEKVSMTPDVLDDIGAAIPEGFILIVCGTPGFRRGGMTHPSRAEYPLNSFTQEQLDAFIAEPRLELVTVGGTAMARATRLYGIEPQFGLGPRDPLMAGRAAADAISRPPNRSEPGLRNAMAGRTPAGFTVR